MVKINTWCIQAKSLSHPKPYQELRIRMGKTQYTAKFVAYTGLFLNLCNSLSNIAASIRNDIIEGANFEKFFFVFNF